MLELGLYGIKVRQGPIDLQKALDYIDNIAFNPARGAREDVTNMVYLLTDLPSEEEFTRIEKKLNNLIDDGKNTLLVTNGERDEKSSNTYNLKSKQDYAQTIKSLLIFACNDADVSYDDDM